MCSQQFLNHHLGVFDLGGIVLAFLCEADLVFLEFVEDIALRNRTQARVFDFADGRLLFHINVDTPALGGLLALNSEVVEVAGVPEGVEVTFQGLLVIHVARTGEHAGTYGVGWNAAVAVDDDFLNHPLLSPGGRDSETEDCKEDTWRYGTEAPPAAEALRRANLAMGRNRNNLKPILDKPQLYGTGSTVIKRCPPELST